MKTVFLAAPILTAALAACAPAGAPPRSAVDTAKIVDAIKTDEVRWNADYKSGDPARIAAHYAPNAVLMIADTPPAVGTAAIESTLKQATGDPAFGLTFASDKVDVAASGDLAAARGTYRLTATDPKTRTVVTATGSYVTVFKPRPDGTWKAVWDINTPTPGPAASVGAVMAGATTDKAPQ
ncbi:MAG: YybH family protein [Caulobacteraceae bacterium]